MTQYYIYIYKIKKNLALFSAAVLAVVILTGCGGQSGTETALPEEHLTGSMELRYANQFHVDYYDEGISQVSIEDGLKYLIVPDPDALPDWAEEMAKDMTVIKAPAESVYMAASSAMDLADAAGCLDAVCMTSTDAPDWGIDKIRDLVESGDIIYIGKYRAPDYEALLEGDIDLAVESTMIYHNPQVKEKIEDMGIPVLVERSSYESEPLGRLEWIKLYGLLLGGEEQAETFFEDAMAKVADLDTESIEDKPSVAFFSVNSSGSVVIRKPGDYVTKMIEMAGGEYALSDAVVEDENAMSTMNIQMEAFYDKAVDSDILIYNSAIEAGLTKVSDLTDMANQFADFKAVKEGNVWCTNHSVFQKTTGTADMIVEMNRIFSGEDDDSGMEYFHKLK